MYLFSQETWYYAHACARVQWIEVGFENHVAEGRSYLPPSGREGDHEVVEGASGHKSREYGLVAGGYGIRLYGADEIFVSAEAS